ncbi:hypothetical protein ThrDRAFT_03934 [Frankia casuarinae]|uniref:Actinorhodin polyketide synthase bifunctional cyclase/dehydratase n=1 Tax=Frankia casuarinae (strain DSM 45818 / CECT 9043 / HFP020203 / CcI3) TaxID=106370 RepID=Q2J5F1_FRACC|nr:MULTISPECIES: aromatase/cyclase [Frankia]ABD13491.1 actinorhodin polyketide synthase bifunctional cyclase/dehydratase [Frankia casuarinae]ETA00051.1 hypothetical protein CcI6DRAFT_04550 [Frankia sp. CcI6]EYT90418.1 hypothetical protein ThrDRAFT_03934 [Frankia casuarinae]KFB02742.1 Polyketide cyclase / dehydrase and lipid transport [Frankia sp. Allo2]OHV49841.1 cyclase [Frankia sp. CgIS1]
MGQTTNTAAREVEHEVEIDAEATTIYGFIADVTRWPLMFPPTVHVEQRETGRGTERIQLWALANDEVKTWTSRRSLDPIGLRVEFRQEVSAPPVASMGGAWMIEPLALDRSRVRLLHDYRAVNDDPAALEWIEQAVDRNSRSELAALKQNAELAAARSDLLLDIDDTVQINGAAADVYDFLNEAQLWEGRLPHVARVTLTEDVAGIQVLEMDTRSKDGSSHTTRSVRVCLPHRKIVYKQTVLPALMTMHTGQWLLEPGADGVRATSRHTVAINEAGIGAVLGGDATVSDARDFVRTALSTNSSATLAHAKEYAERARR